MQWFAGYNSPKHHPAAPEAAGRTWIAVENPGFTCWDEAQTAQLSLSLSPPQTPRVLQTEGAEVPISSKNISQH